MRTPTEALKEIRDRLTYFCLRTDGRYDPPWATELVGIIDEALTESRAIGNAAAMREALEFCLRIIGENGIRGNVFLGDIQEAHRAITAALSAPARNCDIYSDAREAFKAHEEAFNESNFHHGECKLGCPDCDDYAIRCEIKWLLAPAAERKGEGDGR